MLSAIPAKHTYPHNREIVSPNAIFRLRSRRVLQTKTATFQVIENQQVYI